MSKEDNSHWKVSKVYNAQLLRDSTDMIRHYIHGSNFIYFSEYKYPALPKNVRDSLFGLVEAICQENDYTKYSEMRDLLWSILGISKDTVIGTANASYDGMSRGDLGLEFKREKATFPNKTGVKLYHTSERSGIHELKPTFKSVQEHDFDGYKYTDVEALFPTPRVYFGYNIPVSRMMATGESPDDIKENGLRVYLADSDDIAGKTIHVDPELHGKACFVESENPIRCMDITEQYISSK